MLLDRSIKPCWVFTHHNDTVAQGSLMMERTHWVLPASPDVLTQLTFRFLRTNLSDTLTLLGTLANCFSDLWSLYTVVFGEKASKLWCQTFEGLWYSKFLCEYPCKYIPDRVPVPDLKLGVREPEKEFKVKLSRLIVLKWLSPQTQWPPKRFT